MLAVAALAMPARAGFTITFDNLPREPSRTDFKSLSDANNGSGTINGVTFDSSYYVVGDQYVERFSNTGGTDYFSLPHSGDFSVFNASGATPTYITTSQILRGAYFELPDYGGGASGSLTITIEARSGTNVLGSASEVITSHSPTFLDTSGFAAFSTITNYRISVTGSSGSHGAQFVADDFEFGSNVSAVPAPPTLLMAVSGMGLFGGWLRRRRRMSGAVAVV